MKKKLLKDVKARRIWTRSPESRIKDSKKIYNRRQLRKDLVNALQKGE